MSCSLSKRLTLIVMAVAVTMSACTLSQTTVSDQARTAIPLSTPTPTPIPLSIADPIFIGDYALLSPADMRFDLDELFHRLETTHPYPYTHRSKEDVDLDRQRIYGELDQAMSVINYYKKIFPLIASLGDQHTQIYLPVDINTIFGNSELVFPLGVEFEGERAYVTENFTGNTKVALGAEVLEINGVTVGLIKSQASALMELYPFWLSLWFLYGSIPEYQVTLLPPDETEPVVFYISAIASKVILQEIQERPYASLIYAKLSGESIGLLTINDFSEVNQLLDPAFEQIKADNVQHLIIDVRSNAGGYMEKVDSVMKYLTDQPYQHCSRQFLAATGGLASAGPRELECEIRKPFKTSLRFQGNLYLLIGSNSLSAAILFASILQDYHLATLIGEETGDIASFCADGLSGPLPRTELIFASSAVCRIRPSGLRDEHGVIPDVIVKTTIQDRLAGKDPVLEYTLEMIRNQGQTP